LFPYALTITHEAHNSYLFIIWLILKRDGRLTMDEDESNKINELIERYNWTEKIRRSDF
jgi:hypothetical protein